MLPLALTTLLLAAPIMAAGSASTPKPAATPAPPRPRWGDANAANLAAMARPADLLAPAAASPASGAMEAAAVARLLAGQVQDLRREAMDAGGATGPASGMTASGPTAAGTAPR